MKIGVVIQLVDLPTSDHALRWTEIQELTRLVEDMGFDSAWVYDHLLYRNKKGTIGIWEGWSMLSAMAAITRRIEIGTLVACNSFRNPALLAKMAHTVDEISGGRLVLGIGSGWNKPEYDAFGIPFDNRLARFEEALQIIKPLLKEGRVDFAGRYYTARDCEITPRSPRPGGPPLLIGAMGPKMLALTAKYADMWNACYTYVPRSAEVRMGIFQKACKAAGRDFSSIQKTFLARLGYPDLLGWKTAKKRGFLTGSPEELATAFQEYAALGTDHLICHIAPHSRESCTRLAQAVELYRKL